MSRPASLIQRVFLAILGTAMTAVGTTGMVAPDTILAMTQLSPVSLSGYSEIRGMYGGIHLLIGLFILGSFRIADWQQSALIIITLMSFGYGIGRTVSFVIEGMPQTTFLIAWGGELLAGIIALTLLVSNRASVQDGKP